jgi:hypothetical protein
MPNDSVTNYNVEELVKTRKVAMNVKFNTLHSTDPTLTERCMRVDVRRVDSTSVDLALDFYPRIMTRELAGVRTVQRPSASLMWHGKRIRGLDYATKHDVVTNGVIIGSIKGWHEHYWTDLDEDNTIREPRPALQNTDLNSIIAWCAKNWNIENLGMQQGLFT